MVETMILVIAETMILAMVEAITLAMVEAMKPSMVEELYTYLTSKTGYEKNCPRNPMGPFHQPSYIFRAHKTLPGNPYATVLQIPH